MRRVLVCTTNTIKYKYTFSFHEVDFPRTRFHSVKRRRSWLAVLNIAEKYGAMKWVEGWFGKVSFRELNSIDIRYFVRWGAIGRTSSPIDSDEERELQSYVRELERRISISSSVISETVSDTRSSRREDTAETDPFERENIFHSGYYSSSSGSSNADNEQIRGPRASNAPSIARISSIYHPLWFYLLLGGMEAYYQRVILRGLGFRTFDPMHAPTDLAYTRGCRVFYRLRRPVAHTLTEEEERRRNGSILSLPSTGSDCNEAAARFLLREKAQDRPVVLFHGIGAGLFPYHNLIDTLVQTDRPILMLYVPHISMTHRKDMPSLSSMCALVETALVSIFNETSPTFELDIVSHSFGTCLASCLIGRSRERAEGEDDSINVLPLSFSCRNLVMVEPVSIACCLPDLISRLVHDRTYVGVFDMVVRSEIHTMFALQRRLDWMEGFASALIDSGKGSAERRATSRSSRPSSPMSQRLHRRKDTFHQISLSPSPLLERDDHSHSPTPSSYGGVRRMDVFLSSRDAMLPYGVTKYITEEMFPECNVGTFEGTHGQWINKKAHCESVVAAIRN